MKILTKGNKDYYDYLMGIYGQDELVVYDRRNCFPIDPAKKWGDDIDRKTPIHTSDYQNINVELWFRKEVMYCDKPKKEIKKYNSHKFRAKREWLEERNHKKFGIVTKLMEGDIYHFVLEIGFKHFVFEVERYVDDKDPNRIHLECDMVKAYEVSPNDRISYEPMCLCPINTRYYHFLMDYDFKVTDEDKQQAIPNPILYSTYIPKFISADEVWRLLYEYISSLRDKEFEDTRTNEEHIESHGFDKTTSFRKRK